MSSPRLLPHSGPIASLLVACLLSTVGCAGAEDISSASSEPPLVLLIAVDQLRRDRLDSELPGGVGRILRTGRIYEEAVIAHAYTETCPGHASMLTGRHPGPTGIPSNSFIERSSLELRYCVDDPAPKSASFGSNRVGRSPRNLRATTLGDWIKAQHSSARVFSVSGKDRAAIMLGGQKPDGVYWLDWKGSGQFTTSRYYLDELPDWVGTWTRDKILEGVPAQWEHPTGDPPNGLRPDAFVSETPRFSAVSPHPLPSPLLESDFATHAQAAPDDPAATLTQSLAALYFSPFVDIATLRFARELVEREDLGGRDVPDLLAISLSGTDLVGHLYGPWSQEADDALRRLDRALGSFLDFLEARVGADRLLIVLTSDHGVLALPEWLSAQGRATCPVPSGRVSARKLVVGLRAELRQRFGAPLEGGRGEGIGPSAPGWIVREGYRLTVNRRLAADRGVAPSAIVAAAAAFLRAQPGVEQVFTPEEFAASTAPQAALYRNSHDVERGGDLVFEAAAGCLFVDNPFGTTHGSPHAYDRDVPLVIAGRGIRPGRDSSPAATVDLAPTLALLLGIATPPDLDGRVLPLAP